MKLVGRALARLEDARLLTGSGRYAADVRLDRQAWCAFLRSPHAHARIVSLDARAARGPGVLGVLTGGDYLDDGLGPIDHIPNPLSVYDVKRKAFAQPQEAPQWPLPAQLVRHVGEPIALAVAESAEAARDAVERIALELEPLGGEERACLEERCGDEEATRRAFAQAALVVRHTFHHQRVANCQMEPRSAVAAFDPASGEYTLFSGTQGVSRIQHALSKVLGVPAEKIRVVTEEVGGAFGPRTYLYPEQVALLWAAKRFGRPVRWVAERSEAFVSDFQGRDARIESALALCADGRILGYEVRLRGNVGAHTVSFVPMSNFRSVLTTVYDVPAASLALEGVCTPTVPTSPYRGAGRPEAHHALERLLDIAAARLGADRAALRRQNLIDKERLPYQTAMGLRIDAGDFAGYMERALQLAGYSSFEERKAEAGRRGKLRGIGIANYIESPVGAPSEHVALHVHRAGVEIIAGTQSTGQGHATSFAQVLGERLGVPLEKIRLRTGDTAFVHAGGGTHSDRSMRLAGALILRAADALLEQARQAAAQRLEAPAADLVFEDGAFRIAGTDRCLTLLQLAEAQPFAAEESFTGRIPAYPAGSAVCEVEVDPETGAAEVVRYTTVDDVGQAINPLIVEGQTHGGIAQGIGQALYEGVIFESGSWQMLTGSFMDYGLPRSTDLPAFDCELAEDPTYGNALRVKGGGEGGIVPATAAVINALCDALGVEDIPMPATPFQLWRILHRAA